MLVLLKVAADEALPVPTWVPRQELAVGQWTIAVGRTYPGSFPNVSVGILSAINRVWGKAVQTDAKVSPSNYGGPLIDIRGRVIGVLVPLSPQQEGEFAGAEWYDSGIGFAVPLADIWAASRHDETGHGPAARSARRFAQRDRHLHAARHDCRLRRQVARTRRRIAAGRHDRGNRRRADRASEPTASCARSRTWPATRCAWWSTRGENQQRIEMAVALVADDRTVRSCPNWVFCPCVCRSSRPSPPTRRQGCCVRHVFPGSPAAAAGLQRRRPHCRHRRSGYRQRRRTARPGHDLGPGPGRPRAVSAGRTTADRRPDTGSPDDVRSRPAAPRPCGRSISPLPAGPLSVSWKSRFPKWPTSAWRWFRTTTTRCIPTGWWCGCTRPGSSSRRNWSAGGSNWVRTTT